MLTQMLQKSTRANPSQAAIIQSERSLSYQELDRAVARCAGFLREAGVEQGDCVAVTLPNCPEFIVAFFAIARLRAIMLPLHPGSTAEELRRFPALHPFKVLITDPRRQPLARDGFGNASLCVTDGNLWADAAELPPPTDEFAGAALFLYTSGSTDSWKRVCCTQQNLYFEAHNFIESIGAGASDHILCTIPLHHSYGLGNCLLDAIYTGATLVLAADSDEPFARRCPEILSLMRTQKIRFYPAVPYQFEVLAACGFDLAAPFQDVRWCVSSGDFLTRRTYERFLERSGQPIRSLYGSTEAGSIAIDTRAPGQLEYGSLGPPLRNVTIDVRDPAGNPLPTGATGELWVKSPTIPPSGYDNRPELTQTVFRNGFYNSGDLGHLDSRGHLVLAGRRQSFINIGGSKVDTVEVEEVLAACPGIREAAVLGVEVSRMGTLVKAAVVTDRPLHEKDIRAFCRRHLAFFKVPRFIETYAALPRSPIGKVLKSELAGTENFRRELRGPENIRAVAQLRAAPASRQRALLITLVRNQVAEVLTTDVRAVPAEVGFTELGIDSFGSIDLQVRLEYLFDLELPPTFAFDYPTVDAITDALTALLTPIERKARP